MTNPEPTDDPTGQPPADPQNDPKGPPQGDPPADPKDDQPADTTDWKAEARKHEKRAKDNKAAADKAAEELAAAKEREKAALKAYGVGDEEDPAEVAKRTAAERDEAVAAREKAEADVKAVRRATAAERHALSLGADLDLLTDSKAFDAALDELDDEATGEDIQAAMKALLEKHPRFVKASTTTATAPATTPSTGGGEDGPPATSGVEDHLKHRRERRKI